MCYCEAESQKERVAVLLACLRDDEITNAPAATTAARLAASSRLERLRRLGSASCACAVSGVGVRKCGFQVSCRSELAVVLSKPLAR